MAASVALAQNYDLFGFAVDDDGTTFSSCGNYTLAATIGPADAGLSSGGGHTLTAGFLSVPATAQTAVAARLTVTRSVNTVTLTWPTAATGFVLEVTDRLEASVRWAPPSPSPVVQGDQNSVTILVSPAPRVYRLRHP